MCFLGSLSLSLPLAGNGQREGRRLRIAIIPRFTCHLFTRTNDTRNIAEETCLVPAAEGEEERVPNTSSFNFITDIFFLAHKCLDLGFRVVQEKFIKLNQELNRTQELYR